MHTMTEQFYADCNSKPWLNYTRSNKLRDITEDLSFMYVHCNHFPPAHLQVSGHLPTFFSTKSISVF